MDIFTNASKKERGQKKRLASKVIKVGSRFIICTTKSRDSRYQVRLKLSFGISKREKLVSIKRNIKKRKGKVFETLPYKEILR